MTMTFEEPPFTSHSETLRISKTLSEDIISIKYSLETGWSIVNEF